MARQQRKTVTVLFCDLAGSTALGESVDPERLRTLLAAYFERMKGIVEHHGGTVEKFIGDAVMAVFGVPSVHEDDALRACRAAVQMRDALHDLGLEGRIGVMTGEVVTGTDERLATGDAVNVAARLEQAAQPGEVLIGEPTFALVRAAVESDPVEPLALKGKTEPVPAFRLVAVHDAPGRAHGTFVGRREELESLRSAWNRALDGSCCVLFTIVGDAGVGKSRLVSEAVESMPARVLQARCLPYGEGITYWPVVEVLKQLDVRPANETAVAAIRSLLGESDAATSAEEIAWAFRKTLEHAAAAESIVVVFDDIQWGEQTFLDLIEHVALLSSERAILLLCLARPELADLRPTWPITLRLSPLDDEDIDELMAGRASAGLRSKIARAAGGNPLFVEEMLAVSDGSGEVVVPPTLQAVLAARLDRLDSAERRILERGSIEGEIFHLGAVQALAPEEAQVTPRLAALVRKELIRTDRPQIPGDDAFRFRHLLVRDATYDAMPKALRAEFHMRFADWLQDHGVELVELDELLAHHLQRAHDYRLELGLPHEQLAMTARRSLVGAARRASARQDFAAAAGLLERAVGLMDPSELDVAAELALSTALTEIGRAGDALMRAQSLAARARARGNRVGELCGDLRAAFVRTYVEPEGATARLDELAERALPELEAADDDVALHLAHVARGWVAFLYGRTDTSLDAYEKAAVHAQRAGLPDDHLGWRGVCRLYGSTPLPELLAWLDENESQAVRDHWLRASRAMALGLLGRFDEARAILGETRAELAERGRGILLGGVTAIESNLVELLAGDAETAARLGAAGCKVLEEIGDEAFLSSAASCYAQALCQLNRVEEAEEWANRAAGLGASDDAFNQINWRVAKAQVLLRRGDTQEAERLAREAVARAAHVDDTGARGDSHAILGEVLLAGAKTEQAAAELVQSLECYERKGILVSAEHVRARLAELDLASRRRPEDAGCEIK